MSLAALLAMPAWPASATQAEFVVDGLHGTLERPDAASKRVAAALIIAGILTMLGTITVGELANGASVAVVDESRYQGASWLWTVAWIVLAIIGIVYQLRTVAEARLPEEKWVPARAT